MRSLLPLLFLASVTQAAPSGLAPATVSKEADLTTVVLKPEAEQRLRLKTVAVERRAVPGARLFAGEVVQSLAVRGNPAAPLLGGSLDEQLRVADLQVAADGRVTGAQVQVDAALLALERARKVLAAEAGSVRTVDEAKAALAQAEAGLRTAVAQRVLLGEPVGAAGGAPVLWVRTAIYSGEAALLEAGAGATIRALTGTAPGQRAAPVVGPATATAANATVDWYFELPADLKLRPGERVAVEIPLVGARVESLVVPFGAVLHDIHGGQWVYEAMAAHTYVRRRVQVARLVGDVAVLASGPAAGAKIVTDGAAELFGTEFMTGK